MNPWKTTAIGLVVVMVTALVTGLVVANWTGADRGAQEYHVQQRVQQSSARVTHAPARPTASAVEACNKYAASEVGSKDKTMEVVKVGAGGGTLYGLNENRKHDERYRAAYAGCMRARGFTS
jgi:hypothetical protein